MFDLEQRQVDGRHHHPDITTAGGRRCSVLITGGAPADWGRLIPRQHRQGHLTLVACGRLTDSEFSAILARCRPGTLVVTDIDRIGPAQADLLFDFLGQQHPSGAVRVIAASTAPLYGMVAAGGFSPALFYRLNLISLDLDTPHPRLAPS